MLWIQLLTLPVLGAIAYEDLRERSIHWWWLPLLAAGLAVPAIASLPNGDYAAQTGFNLGFLVLQLGGTLLFFLLRYRRWVNPVDRFIGLGDLLFFGVLALGLSRTNFIVFLLSGLALCLPAYFVLVRLHPGTPRTVPTAGFLAIYLFLWSTLDLTGLVPGLLTGSWAEDLLAHGG